MTAGMLVKGPVTEERQEERASVLGPSGLCRAPWLPQKA